jgi:hypothetical protein
MRFLVVAALLASQFLPQAIGQDKKTPDQKLHMLIGCSTCGSHRIHLIAARMQRDAPDPAATKVLTSAIQLRGDVEIKTEHMVLRADEADYHEDTGEIEVRGNVRVTLGYQHGWTQ